MSLISTLVWNLLYPDPNKNTINLDLHGDDLDDPFGIDFDLEVIFFEALFKLMNLKESEFDRNKLLVLSLEMGCPEETTFPQKTMFSGKLLYDVLPLHSSLKNPTKSWSDKDDDDEEDESIVSSSKWKFERESVSSVSSI